MPLSNGTVLGPYEIVAPIGAGGMGEVYRARDTRLDRSVAIKILPTSLASNPALRARFDREARAISGLTHANICALYDVGHQDGIDYLVMEYLEGESLADKLARGPLPPSQVLRYGADVAQALHHAHRRGITHRDLKPGNVMITPGGAKLLDFGLAKLAVQQHEIAPDAPTMTDMKPVTAEGTIVGTLPYMSPEQIEGKELDARSDIFSLGVMLYEMATGRRPFAGASSTALAASILSSDPPSQPALTPALDRVVRTALEKDPDQRFQSAQDLARQLRWISEPSATTQPAMSAPARPRMAIIAALAIAAMLLGLIGWVATRWRRSQDLPPMHLAVALPGLEVYRTAEQVPFAVSPDGRTIAVAAFENAKRWLFVRRLDSGAVRKLDGTEGALSPFWSSDGAWIAYSAHGKLWKTKLSGGAPQPVCDAPAGATGTWRNDTILFVDLPGGRNIVYRVPASGGTAVPVTTLNAAEGEGRHSFPHLLADGKHFLYVSSVAQAERRLMMGSLDAPLRKRVATNVSLARSTRDRLLFVRDGKLIAQPFDVAAGLTGDPQTVVDNVSFFFMSGRAEFDVSVNGVVVYGTRMTTGRLVLADRAGTELRVMTDESSTPYTIDVSPDGKRAAVTVSALTTRLMDIWIYDLARDVRDRLTSDPGVETTPAWAPDGRSMIYSAASGRVPMLMHRVISTGATTVVGGPGSFQTMGSFAPDGNTIYYMAREGRSIGIVRMALDSKKSEVLIDDPSFWEHEPQVSPDGRRLAFVSDASGIGDVYVQELASGERARISTRGGGLPRWRADSGELFYVSHDNGIMSVTPRGGRWDDAAVVELFRARNDVESFDALPDGKSFLLSERIPSPSDALIHVINGW